MVLVSLTGCHPIDRLLGINKNEGSAPAAVAPAPQNPAPPAAVLPRYETYHFTGNVRSGGTQYFGTIAAGDAVEGTFRIDFEPPASFTSASFQVYEALANISGTVGGYPFSGSQNLVYVKPSSGLGFWVDTGYLRLDTTDVSFDMAFQLLNTTFPDSALANLRSLDQRSYADVDLWFETDSINGKGFNTQITSIQRAEAPLTLASVRR